MSDESDLDNILNDDDFSEFGGFANDKVQDDKPVAAGEHPAEIESAKMVLASDGQRAYGAISNLEIRWRIIGGSESRRVIFERISLKHEKADVVERARSTMASIRLALGLESIPNAQSLVGGRALIKVVHSVPKKGNETIYANVRKHSPIPAGTVIDSAGQADEAPF